VNKLKSSVSGGFPIRKNTMPRKMSDVTPLKGLPSRPMGQAGFRNSRVPMPSRSDDMKSKYSKSYFCVKNLFYVFK
jgi:hypothetical protein